MKALSIIALVFAAISLLVPVVGVFLAMLCSVLALISFRTSPTLSGVAFGINIIGTAFLSPSLIVAAAAEEAQTGNGAGLYWFYVGFHVVLFIIAIAYFMIKNKKSTQAA